MKNLSIRNVNYDAYSSKNAIINANRPIASVSANPKIA